MMVHDVPRGGFLAAALVLAFGLAACSDDESSLRPAPRAPSAPGSTGSSTPPSGAPSASDPSTSATAGIVASANAFLAALSERERDSVLFDRDDREQKQRWSNLPQGVFDRAGLMVGDLEQGKVDAFLAMMRATLSPEGYNRVIDEWAADDALSARRGGSIGRQYYWLAIVGEPSPTEPWQWQFGGHHLSVNATIEGSALSMTPSFLGAEPATYDADGDSVRPLGDITDQAFDLVNSLNGGLRQRAVLGTRPIDLVLGAGQDCRAIPPEGLPGSAMTAAQRTAFLALLGKYGGLGNAQHAAPRRAQLEADLAGTHFAWYGPTTPGSAAYFRITGPHVVIEYSPQAMGGDPENHIHGIYRDPTNDYGGTVC
jgi:Protein of unknown function (DUF3500)